MEKYLKPLIDKAVAALLPKISGAPAWLVSLALKYGGQYITDLVSDLITKIVRYFKQEKALKDLEEVNKDPNSTVDERAKEYEKTINTH